MLKTTNITFDNKSNIMVILTLNTTEYSQYKIIIPVQLPTCNIMVNAHALLELPHVIRIVHK